MAPDVVPEDTTGNALDVVINFISSLDPSTAEQSLSMIEVNSP